MSEIDLSRYDGSTPGPWKIDTDWGHETLYLVDAFIGTTKFPACGLWGTRKDDQQAANARLIADAPLLLAEVKRLREVCKAKSLPLGHQWEGVLGIGGTKGPCRFRIDETTGFRECGLTEYEHEAMKGPR